MTILQHPVAVLVVLSALASGCANSNYKAPAPIIGGFMSPQVARTGCIDAVARDRKVPREDVKPLYDAQTMKEGIYVMTLSIGAGQPNINCTVNENGVVSDVIRAR